MNKKGFTLIELLAVIIILGILMIIAIPAVSKYINDTKKTGYVSTAKSMANGAKNLINSGSLDIDDVDTTYYIDARCIKVDNDFKSPYGDFEKAYVVVTVSDENHDYFWTSVDSTGTGVKGIVNINGLDNDKIETDINVSDITTDRGLDDRSKIVVVNSECQKEPSTDVMGSVINSLTGKTIIDYPEGKTKGTVVVGDIITIGTEEFYLVKKNGNDLVLLSHYNLNVGNNMKTGATEGIQDSEVRGSISNGTKYGNLSFSSASYWSGKVGTDYPGSYCNTNTPTPGVTCAYVYDSNSNLKVYVDAYKDYLKEQKAPIKSARLLKVEEAYDLGCGNGAWNCNNAPSFIKETSFWLGSVNSTSNIWRIDSVGGFGSSGFEGVGTFGVRPVIVI